MELTKHRAADRVAGSEESTWVEIFNFIQTSKPEVNLGHGFPDFLPPNFITEALAQIATANDSSLHQYTQLLAHPRLFTALNNLYSQLLGRPLLSRNELVVTNGAYNGLFCSILGLVNPGDEVIILEPFYEAFEVFVKMAGGIPVFVPLRPVKNPKSHCVLESSEWLLDCSELVKNISSKTKMLILNNPLNPIGKVFKKCELEEIRIIALKFDLIILADEVYEFLIFDGEEHIKFATLPDMWDRTITIGSAGKTFSVTGWKTGWVYGPAHLMKGVQLMFMDTQRVGVTPIQEAIAVGFEREFPLLGKESSYWKWLSNFLAEKRTHLIETLMAVGMKPTVPKGGYFIIADYSELEKKIPVIDEEGSTKDIRFVKWLSRNKKIHTMPLTPFFCKEHIHLGENYIRLCFSKENATLEKARGLLDSLQ